MSAEGAPHVRSHACDHCDQRFVRKEHLERHLARHSGSKRFSCDHCGKSFARSDSLRRHLIAHGVQVDSLPRMRKSRTGACKSCARQKKRCTGGIPCDNCTRRNASCVILDAEQHHDGLSSASHSAQHDASSSATAPSDGMRPPQGGTSSPLYENNAAQIQHLAQSTTIVSTAESGLDYYGSAMHPRLSSLDEWSWTGVADHTPENVFNQGGVIALPTSFTSDGLFGPFVLDHTQMTTAWRPDNHYESAGNVEVQRHATLQQPPAPLAWPALSDHDIRVLASENFGEAPPLAGPVLNRLMEFCETQYYFESRGDLEPVLRTFIELYFRHFAPTYPFLHSSNLCSYEISWILLLVVALIGSKYSQLQQALRFTKVLGDLAGKAIEGTFSINFYSHSLPWAQIRLLYDISLLWAGNRDLQLKQQFGKNTLISICRALKMEVGGVGAGGGGLSGGRFDNDSTSLSIADFDRWLANESRIRLFHQAYCHECLQYVFLDIKPSMDLSEFTECVPCDATLWNCRNKDEWILAMKRQGQIPASVLHVHQKRINDTSGMYRGIRLLYSHTEERVATEFVRRQQHRNLHTSVADTTPANGIGGPLLESNTKNTDEMSTPSSTAPVANTNGSTSECHALYLVLRVLRIMPLRTLYALSGWQATAGQRFAAQNIFQEFVDGQPAKARLGLVYALSAFVSTRLKAYFEPYDPVCALTAALYIWSYDTLSNPPLLGPPMEDSDATTIRFERCDRDVVCSNWVETGGPTRIYLVGVGFLDGKTSPSRILHELYRLLNSRTQWHGLCSGLARIVQQLIHGQRPQFQNGAVGD